MKANTLPQSARLAFIAALLTHSDASLARVTYRLQTGKPSPLPLALIPAR